MQIGHGGINGAIGNGGGLGHQLIGEKIEVNKRFLSVVKLLGEGAFSFVYLVQDEMMKKDRSSSPLKRERSASPIPDHTNSCVLKITSISSREQKEIAEKEANLLSRLNHPSIVTMHDFCYRSVPQINPGLLRGTNISDKHTKLQHLILMEFCEDGHALDVMQKMEAKKERFTLNSLIIAFGQICNAVSYIHAQKPSIVHRDLKPSNFLVSNGSYKLCDFGSAIFGEVPLNNQSDRVEADEIIQKTTTQMFRAPEMVDLYMTEKLTKSTDVWALGCCLYSMAFFQNCFEEGSNLAIISNNYKIPERHPFGNGLVDLIDRMLTVDYKERADMTEVIMCLSALYAGKKLPSRRKGKKNKGKKKELHNTNERIGSYRTNGQGINHPIGHQTNKPSEAKKLDPNSAAARRKALYNTDSVSQRSSPAQEQKKHLEQSHVQKSSSYKKSSFANVFDASFENFAADFKFESESGGPCLKEDLFCTTNNPFSSEYKTERQDLRQKKDNFNFEKMNSSLPNSDGFENNSKFSAFEDDPSPASVVLNPPQTADSDDLFPDSIFKFSAFPLTSLASKSDEDGTLMDQIENGQSISS